MHQSKQVSKNYAQALIELMNTIQEQESVLNELMVIDESISKVSQAKDVFETPVISKDTKKELIKKLFQGKINQKLLNFLFILVDNQRFSILSSIKEHFQKLVNKSKGITFAEVSSACELDKNAMDNLKKHLEQLLGEENISIETKTDSSLIGGVKVKINDLVYDGSVKGRLEGLKRKLEY